MCVAIRFNLKISNNLKFESEIKIQGKKPNAILRLNKTKQKDLEKAWAKFYKQGYNCEGRFSITNAEKILEVFF